MISPYIRTLVLVAILMVGSGCNESSGKPRLVMFCAAGIRKPVTTIAREYEAAYGVVVEIQFGGSGTLLSKLEVGKADLYLAADGSYTELAREKGLVESVSNIAVLRPGLAVTRGNPKAVGGLDALKNGEVKVAIGNPEASAIGKITREMLLRNGLWKELNPTVSFPTVNEVANAVKLGTVEVGIIWDAVALQYPELEFIPISESEWAKATIAIAVLKASKQQDEAQRFCDFLTSKTGGLKVFELDGFESLGVIEDSSEE